MSKLPWLQPITARIEQPGPDIVRRARCRAGLGQAEAAQLISSATSAPHRVWQNFEAIGSNHRDISPAAWELFLLLTDQHPALRLVERTTSEQNRMKNGLPQ